VPYSQALPEPSVAGVSAHSGDDPFPGRCQEIWAFSRAPRSICRFSGVVYPEEIYNPVRRRNRVDATKNQDKQ